MNGTMSMLDTQRAVIVDSVGWYLERVQFGETNVQHFISLYYTNEFSLYDERDRESKPIYFIYQQPRPAFDVLTLVTKTYIPAGVAVVFESTAPVDFFYVRLEDGVL
jgi:hypothetical protein